MSENYSRRMRIWQEMERMKEYEEITTITAQNGITTYYYKHGGTKIIDSLGGIKYTDPTFQDYINLKKTYQNSQPLLIKLRDFFTKKKVT